MGQHKSFVIRFSHPSDARRTVDLVMSMPTRGAMRTVSPEVIHFSTPMTSSALLELKRRSPDAGPMDTKVLIGETKKIMKSPSVKSKADVMTSLRAFLRTVVVDAQATALVSTKSSMFQGCFAIDLSDDMNSIDGQGNISLLYFDSHARAAVVCNGRKRVRDDEDDVFVEKKQDDDDQKEVEDETDVDEEEEEEELLRHDVELVGCRSLIDPVRTHVIKLNLSIDNDLAETMMLLRRKKSSSSSSDPKLFVGNGDVAYATKNHIDATLKKAYPEIELRGTVEFVRGQYDVELLTLIQHTYYTVFDVGSHKIVFDPARLLDAGLDRSTSIVGRIVPADKVSRHLSGRMIMQEIETQSFANDPTFASWNFPDGVDLIEKKVVYFERCSIFGFYKLLGWMHGAAVQQPGKAEKEPINVPEEMRRHQFAKDYAMAGIRRFDSDRSCVSRICF